MLGRLELTGPPVPVLEDVSFYAGTGTAGFTFSQSGMFVYVVANPEDQMRPIGLMDEKGKVELLPVARARYGRPRISPDGSRLAVAIKDGPATNIWIYELGKPAVLAPRLPERQLDIPRLDARRQVPGILQRCARLPVRASTGCGRTAPERRSVWWKGRAWFRLPFPHPRRGWSMK